MKELQLKAQELSKQGLSTRAVARELGITPSRAYNMISGKYNYNGPKKAPVDRIKELRKQGMLVSDIATKLGVSESTVSRYAAGLGDKMYSGRDGAIELGKKGLSHSEIASIMAVKESTVSSYLSGSGVASRNENKELAICLRMDGYYLDEVSDIMGVSKDYISELTSGHGPFVRRKTQVKTTRNKAKAISMYRSGVSPLNIASSLGVSLNRVYVYIKGEIKPKVKPKKIKMKKEVKQTVSAIEQRAVLGQGVEAGVYNMEVKLNPNRDNGRIVTVFYKEYGGTVNRVDIRVRDGVSDTEAGERWCKKFNREFLYTK